MNHEDSLTLCLDVGNSNILGGTFKPDASIGLRFRKTSSQNASADEYGIFLKAALRENGLDPAVKIEKQKRIAILDTCVDDAPFE